MISENYIVGQFCVSALQYEARGNCDISAVEEKHRILRDRRSEPIHQAVYGYMRSRSSINTSDFNDAVQVLWVIGVPP